MELYLLDILVFSNNFIVPRGYFTVKLELLLPESCCFGFARLKTALGIQLIR
jgi:hypothetical protein